MLPLLARLLPLDEGAGIVGDAGVVEDPDPRHQRLEQGPVVADQKHIAAPRTQRVLQHFDRLDIEVIGRLVEDEQVGVLEHHHRKSHPGPLAAGEGARAAEHRVAAEPKRAEVALDGATIPHRAEVGGDVVQRLLLRYLRHVLPVPGGGDGVAETKFAAAQGPLAEQGAEERRLAGAVRADEADDLAAGDAGRETVEQHPVIDLDPDVLRHEDLVAAPFPRREVDGHAPLFAGGRAEAREPFEPAPPALGLGAVPAGDVPPDEVLLRLDVLALLVERPLLRQLALGALLEESLVAGLVGGDGLRLEVEDPVGQACQERAVVADDQDSGVETEEVVLQPAGGLEVEVVGRLVEEEDVGGGHELAGQRDAAPLATAEGGHQLGARRLGVEAEAVKHGIDARSEGVPAVALEALEIAGVAIERGLGRIGAEPGGLFRERCLQGEQLREGTGGGLPHPGCLAEVAMLVHERDAQPRFPCNGPPARLGGTGEKAEEGGLPGPVPADHAPALATFDGKGGVGKEPGDAELDRQAGHRELTHDATHSFQVSSAAPIVSRCWFRTRGVRSSIGSSASRSSQRSSDRAALRRPRSANRFPSRSTSACTPNFWANRRSSPGEAALTCRSTKCVLMRRSAKNRRALRVSWHFFVPKT